MKKILIYGDSNTWGDNFITGERIPDDKQWPHILEANLKDYKILQEGLPGRIAGDYEDIKKYKNGKDSFLSTFRVNAPVDIVIIALGTNDLQLRYDKSSDEVIQSLKWYKEAILNQFEDLEDRKKYFVNETLPRIIYIMPANFDYLGDASVIFDSQSEEKRQEIIKYFSTNEKDVIICPEMPLFNDGIHFNYDGHQLMAKLVEEVIASE